MFRRRALGLLLVVTICAGRLATFAFAYIDGPAEKLTLPQLLLEFRSVSVLQVDRLDLEKGVVLFKPVERVQGRGEPALVRHAVKYDGGVPAELKGLKPGQQAVFFSGDGYTRGITLVEGAWYCSTFDRKTGWWHIAYTAGHYDFNCAFAGSVPELLEAIGGLLRGEEVVVKCRKKSRQPETQLVRSSLRQPQRKEVVAGEKPAPQAPANSDKAVATLVKSLQDIQVGVRVGAAQALGRLGTSAREATPALSAALVKDKDPFVRRAAAVALGNIGPEAKAAVPALLTALQSHYENVEGLVGSECAVAIGRIDADGRVVVPLVMPKLKDPNGEVRLKAAGWLAILGPVAKSAVPDLIEAMKDKDDGVRHAAVGALASVGAEPKVTVPVLTAALKDQSKFVRFAAARALGEIGLEAKSALAALREASKDADEEVRQYAVEAIKAITPP